MEAAFEPAVAKLAHRDTYTQGDGARELFDAWFSIAKAFATGSEDVTVSSMLQATRLLMDRSLFTIDRLLAGKLSDEYVAGACLENLNKLCTIFTTKPKFEVLCFTDDGVAMMQWVNKAVMPTLSEGIASVHVQRAKRIESLKTAKAMLSWGQHLADSGDALYDGVNPLDVEAGAAVSAAVKVSNDSVLRSAALDMLRSLARARGAAVARMLVRHADDADALAPVWDMGVLLDNDSLRTLVDRLRGDRESRFTLDMLTSLYEATLNWRNRGVAHVDGSASMFHPVEQEEALLVLLREADAGLESTYKDLEAVGDVHERNEELLNTLGALLDASPDSAGLIHLAMTPLTVGGLNTIAAACGGMSETTWRLQLLPRCDAAINDMQLAGVSGSQLEQSVVDLVRDCARLFYLSLDRHPSPELARDLYHVVLNAMAHGYYETERFSEIAALIIDEYIARGAHRRRPGSLDRGKTGEDGDDDDDDDDASGGSGGGTAAGADGGSTLAGPADSGEPDGGGKKGSPAAAVDTLPRGMRSVSSSMLAPPKRGGLSWALEALHPRIAHNHKTWRAIMEIFLRLLGVELTSLGVETSRETSPETARVVLNALANCATEPALRLWSDLFLNAIDFVSGEEAAIATLLKTLDGEVERMIHFQAVALDVLEPVADVARHIALRVTPPNAAPLFDLLLKVMALHPSADTAYCDAALHGTIRKIPQDAVLSSGALRACVRLGGPEARAALARLVPQLLLTDPEPSVRVAAMRVMMKHPALIPEYAEHVLASCTAPAARSTDGRLELWKVELATASAPLLAALARAHPPSLPGAVTHLTSAALVSKENSIMSKPDGSIVQQLGRVVRESSVAHLLRFTLSELGRDLLPDLVKLSPAWGGYVATTMDSGLLRHAPGLGYRATDDGKRHVEDMMALAAAYSDGDGGDGAAGGGGSAGGAGGGGGSAAAASTEDALARTLYDTVRSLVDDREYMRAVEQAALLRSRFPGWYEREEVGRYVGETLLPKLAQARFPMPTWGDNGLPTFTDAELDSYDDCGMRELQQALPEEAETYLHVSARMADFHCAIVRRFLDSDDPEQARTWMEERDIFSPALNTMIDRYSFSKASAVIATPVPALTPPPAARSSSKLAEDEDGKAAPPAVSVAPFRVGSAKAVAPDVAPMELSYLHLSRRDDRAAGMLADARRPIVRMKSSDSWAQLDRAREEGTMRTLKGVELKVLARHEDYKAAESDDEEVEVVEVRRPTGSRKAKERVALLG